MAQQASDNPLLGLRLFLAAQTPPEIPDHVLLERFRDSQDETAFAALVHRHSAMILGTCRRILRNPHDAEDACQASFLILAHHAAAIHKPGSLASWLHRVAVRVARDLRAKLARRVARPLGSGDDLICPEEPKTLIWSEVREALDEELGNLPEHYRAALVLCYLEGRSRDEAALQLGWSLATLHGQLERGRTLLHDRLVRRGLTLSAALTVSSLFHGIAMAAVPASLVLQIVRTGTSCATGGPTATSALIATLVNGALPTMFRFKTKHIVLLALTLLLGLGGYGAYRAYWAEPTPQAWATALTSEEVKAEETVSLAGRVLDPDGRPLAGAELYVIAGWNSPLNEGGPQAKSGPDGQFTLDVPKSELARHLVASRPVDILASAKGFGIAWSPAVDFLPKEELNKLGSFRSFTDWSAHRPVLRMALDDVPVAGRIETQEGKPVVGAKVYLERLFANEANDLTSWDTAVSRNEDFGVARKLLPRELGGDGLNRFVATTDKDGHFQMKGLGRNRLVSFRLEGPGLAAATIVVRTEQGPRLDISNLGSWFGPDPHGCFGAEFAISAGAGQPIVGVVKDADTGLPVAGALVQSHRFAGNKTEGLPMLQTKTDAQGRYRLDGMPAGKGNALLARGPKDQPYLPSVAEVEKGEGDGPVVLELTLKRGLWAEGQVTDAATGKPLAANIDYYCLFDNLKGAEAPGFQFGAAFGAFYHTDATGRFRVPVLPGPGLLAAMLQGERIYLFGTPSTWQGGKRYSDFQGKFDLPNAINGGTFVPARPFHFQVYNYHQVAVIDPGNEALSVKCDLPVYADGSALKPAAKKEGGK